MSGQISFAFLWQEADGVSSGELLFLASLERLQTKFVSFCPFPLSKYRLRLLAVSGAGMSVANLGLRALSSPGPHQPKF